MAGVELRSPRTRVKTGPHAAVGAPIAQIYEGTPVQPIVIQVPTLPHDMHKRVVVSRGAEVWVLVTAVLVSVFLSGLLSVYVASEFLVEYSNKIDRLGEQLDTLDNKLRALRNVTTKLETQIENDNALPTRVERLNRKLRTLETTVVRLETQLDD